jgi:C_GCAxxG_C_C family probable redox protein
MVATSKHRAKRDGMETKGGIAVRKLSEGYNCAQSVFYSFCDDLQFDKDSALRLACGFGAGMGRKGEVCGAVSGGIMVIGAKFGKGEKGASMAAETTYRKTREFMDQFASRNGSFVCRRLLNGCDLTTEEGRRQFRDNDLFNRVCKPCVQSAVEILEGICGEV